MADAAVRDRSRVARGARGAVVAPHHLATSAGLAVLAAGGHAVDAAIATNAVLGVVMPSGCGIGGDAFWLVWDEAAGEQVALNGSGRAPAAADAAGAARLGPRPDPAARAAGDHRPGRGPVLGRRPRALGPPVPRRRPRRRPSSTRRPGSRRGTGSSRRSTGPSPRSAAALGRRASGASGGPTAARGERASGSGSPALARTLRTLADDGFDAYYDGDLGERIVRGLAAAGSPSTATTCASTAPSGRRRSRPTYRGVRVTTHPPNSSGLVALQILNDPRAVRAAAAGARSAPRLVGRRAGSTSSSRRPSSPSPTATRTSPTRPSATSPWTGCSATTTPRRSPRASIRRAADRAAAAPGPLVGGTIYLARRRRRRQRGEPHPVERRGLRVRRPRPRDRHPLPEPRRVVLARPGQRERPRARQADARTRSSRGCCSATGSGARGWSPGRWAATSSPRSTPSSCRRSSTAARTSRRRSGRRGSSSSRPAPSRRRRPCSPTASSRRASPRASRALATTSARRPFDGEPRASARDRAGRRRPGGGRHPRGRHRPAERRAAGGPIAVGGPEVVGASRTGRPRGRRMVSSGSRWQAALTPICRRHRRTREGRVTSNVGQNYPYTSETESDRAPHVASLVADARRAGRQARGRDHAARHERALVGLEVPDHGLPGLLHAAGLRPREARRVRRLRRDLREDLPALTPARRAQRRPPGRPPAAAARRRPGSRLSRRRVRARATASRRGAPATPWSRRWR